MTILQFKVITDEKEAQNIWEEFSPHQTLDDEWDFRNAFVSEFSFPFHFIVGYNGDMAVGLLPLQKNTVEGLGPTLLEIHTPFLEFFGGVDTDNNRIFFKDGYENEENIQQFLSQIQEPAILSDLLSPYKKGSVEAEHTNDKFELPLDTISSFEEYLQANFDGKSRQRLINRINHISGSFTVDIAQGTAEDLNTLFQYSIDRFGEKSSFNLPYRRRIYEKLMEKFPVDLIAIKLNSETKAVAFCIDFKGIYTSVNIGYEFSVRDISKLLVVTQIKRAIERGCKIYDAGKGDNGWKEHFHLTKKPQYTLRLI